jgi:hypothetical protein
MHTLEYGRILLWAVQHQLTGRMQLSQSELGNPGLGQLVLSITYIDFTSLEYEFPKN